MKSSYSSFLEVIKDFFKNPALRRPLLISVILHASQQITGIGAVRILCLLIELINFFCLPSLDSVL